MAPIPVASRFKSLIANGGVPYFDTSSVISKPLTALSVTSDGVSIIETADGAMSEISEMLQRMNELAMKAANGVESDSDREVIQDEVKQLTAEITRVADSTEFNGQRLLNGEFSRAVDLQARGQPLQGLGHCAVIVGQIVVGDHCGYIVIDSHLLNQSPGWRTARSSMGRGC